MATTGHSASISTERAHAPRFRFGSLEAWRAALFVSLGLGAACGGDADGGDGASALSSSLQCQGDDALPSGLWQCDNGIVHRRTGSDDEPCVGCIRPPLSPSDECCTDADCADGSSCAQTRDLVNASLLCGLPVIEVGVPYFACLSSADTCGADSQCRGAICARAEGVRECYEHTAQPCGIPGRPFLVGAEIRRAPLRATGGWCDANIAPADGLDERQRVSAARHYREAALLEHASIAAFARFTLQLLELGAPTDPDVRRALERIAHDERRHAELAFRFVAWALEQRPHSGLRHALAAVLEATVGVSRCAADDDASAQRRAEAPATNDASGDDAQLEAHGLLSERRRSALRRAVLEEVVVPCVRRLLAEAGARRPQPPGPLAQGPTGGSS